jgi:hypothetical protein
MLFAREIRTARGLRLTGSRAVRNDDAKRQSPKKGVRAQPERVCATAARFASHRVPHVAEPPSIESAIAKNHRKARRKPIRFASDKERSDFIVQDEVAALVPLLPKPVN